MKLSKSECGKLGAISSREGVLLRKENNIKRYNENPVQCEECGIKIPYERRFNRFCSRSCSATQTNSLCPKRIKIPKERKQATKFKEIRKQKFEEGKIKYRQYLKKCILEFVDPIHHCHMCKRKEWEYDGTLVPIPLELDHINGDPSNDFPSNLRLLCPNCHALTPTAKGKNKGNGRQSRGLIRR